MATRPLVAAILGFVAIVAVACSDSGGGSGDDSGSSGGPGGLLSDIDSMCDAVCACQDCDDDDVQKCLDEGNKSADAAADAECDDELDDLLGCIDDEATCDNGKFRFTDACESESEAIDECTSGVVHADDGVKPLDQD